MLPNENEFGLIVFVGATGDHNDRGMVGASIVGRELGRRIGRVPAVIGKSRPATSEPWDVALRGAIEDLRALQRGHRTIVERGGIPVAALPRCAASLATLPSFTPTPSSYGSTRMPT